MRSTGSRAPAREGTLRFARAAGPARARRGLWLAAGLVVALGVTGALSYSYLARRGPFAARPSATTLSPDAAAALARVRELEARLAELEREKAAMEAKPEPLTTEDTNPSSPSPTPTVTSAEERARAEARRRARAERERREAEIRRLEEELRTAEQLLVEDQQTAQAASDVDFSSILPAVATPPTPEPAPPPTTRPPVRPGDLVEASDPAVRPPVFLGGRPVGYPPAAQRLQREGTVVLDALVDETGSVADAKVVESSDPGLGFEEAATRQAMSRRYRPATKNGIPVRVRIQIRVNFTLH
jgi:TonB family protein